MRQKSTGELSWDHQKLSPEISSSYNTTSVSASFFEPTLPETASFEWVSPPLQYSGITTKGVDIYEGDRGKNNVAEWEVTFNKGCFCGKRIGGEETETHIALRAIQEFEYSGNIYEDKFKNEKTNS